MSAYSDGRKLEYAAQKALEAEGYITMRAAGSKGAVDVLGFKQGQVVMVQCKLDGYLTPGERAKVYGLAAMCDAVPLIARWHKEGRAARQVVFGELLDTERIRTWTADHGFEPAWRYAGSSTPMVSEDGIHFRPRDEQIPGQEAFF